MKINIKFIILLILGGIFVASCNKEQDSIYKSPGEDDAQYVQLVNGERNYKMNPLDSLIEFEVGVRLLGPVAKKDVEVKINVEKSDVDLDKQVVFESYTAIIPKGSYSGSAKVIIHPHEFPLEDVTKFLEISISCDELPLADVGTSTKYSFYYNECPYDISEFIGEFKVTYGNNDGKKEISETWTISKGEGDTLIVDGIWYNGPPVIWSETMVDKKPIKIVFDTSVNPPNIYLPLNADGTAQYLNSSTDGTDVYQYYIFDFNTATGTTDYNWELLTCDRTLTFKLAIGSQDYQNLYEYMTVVLEY